MTTSLPYIKKLIAFKNTHAAALRGVECVRDLIAMDDARKGELATVNREIAERQAYISKVESQIYAARAQLAA